MKAYVVIDDVTQEPHILSFRGVEYDLQMTFAAKVKIEKFGEKADAINEYYYLCGVLAILMNESSVVKRGEAETVTADDLMNAFSATKKTMDALTELLNAVNGVEPEDETPELDALIDAEVPDDPQKN